MRIGIVSLIAWDFLHQRPQKFAEELAALGHTIYYVEPTDFGRGRYAHLTAIRQRVPAFRPVAPRIFALRPVLYPPFRAYAARQGRNRWLAPIVVQQLRRLRLDFLIVLAPEYAPVVEQLGVPFAYDHVDDTQFMEHIETARFVAAMERLLARSAFNIYIQEDAARRDPKGVYIANGVDAGQFFPVEAPKLFDAVVLSNIARWFDMDSVLASRQRILLIGPMDTDGGDNRARFFAAARPNLAWIPQVDKETANLWLSRAEVGLVPFDYRHPVLHYAMPLKILEYFLAGLPVVTYRNDGITRQYGKLVTYYAGDGSEPLDLDAAIAAAKGKRGAHDYRAFAARFQWRDLVADLERHIRAHAWPGAGSRR
jgi:glycosyltransferase involved in cell wall biosynthesis